MPTPAQTPVFAQVLNKERPPVLNLLNLLKVNDQLAARRVLALLALACAAMLAFGLYLQHVESLNPCPMCIVQRYALILVGVFSGLASLSNRKSLWFLGSLLALVSAVLGAVTAANQSWLQWFPPEVAMCGRDLYGMIETFPLKRAIPMIFRGGGDCAAVDWTLFGATIANWAFICFTLMALACLAVLRRCLRRG